MQETLNTEGIQVYHKLNNFVNKNAKHTAQIKISEGIAYSKILKICL